MFPNDAELERYRLKPQNQPWEKYNITEKEAWEKLARWAEKRLKSEIKKVKEVNNITVLTRK
jgi:hypothetical protein